MHRQVGDLQLDASGVAERGLLVRHLVMPDRLSGTASIVKFIANEISRDTYLNIMDQYHPCGQARGKPHLGRRITLRNLKKLLMLPNRPGSGDSMKDTSTG